MGKTSQEQGGVPAEEGHCTLHDQRCKWTAKRLHSSHYYEWVGFFFIFTVVISFYVSSPDNHRYSHNILYLPLYSQFLVKTFRFGLVASI